MRVLPPRPWAVVQGWPDDEGNAVEVLRGLARRYPGTVYWLRHSPGQHIDLPEFAGAPDRLVVVPVNTRRAFALVFRAEVTFFTHGMMTAVRPPRSRLVVNLWHGDGPKLSADLARSAATVAVAATRLWAEVKAEMFRLPLSSMAVVGNPRVDAMLVRPAAEVRQRLALPAEHEERLVLWLPTYRRGWDGRHVTFADGDPLSERLQDRITVPPGVTLVVKPHPMDRDDYSGLGAKVLTNDDLADAGIPLAQLVGAADALISDASSAWVDYLSLHRPVGFFLPDLDEYDHTRGYNVPDIRAVLPGPVLTDPAAVGAFLEDVRDGRARTPETYDAWERIGYRAEPPVTDHLLDWLDDHRRAHGAKPLFATGPRAAAHP